MRWQLERLGDRFERAGVLDMPLAALGRGGRLLDRVMGR